MDSPLIDHGSQFIAYGLFGYLAMAGVLQIQAIGGISVELAAYIAVAIGILMAFKMVMEIFMLDTRIDDEYFPTSSRHALRSPAASYA